MKVLVFNCGSSSVKYKLFDMQSSQVIASGEAEKIGLVDSNVKIKVNGEKIQVGDNVTDHQVAVEKILDVLTGSEYGVIKDLNEINAVGHRVVHGGQMFSHSVLITPEVVKAIESCSDMAPLHNPANLKGIYTITKLLPHVPQVAVFDTAFHQTMPDYAYMYGIDPVYYDKYAIRRYGFHGTSHRYVSKRACEFLGIDAKGTKMITCHIGNGASLTAIKDGESIDTSMGFTPLEGLIMGTRSGDIDPGAVTYLMDKEGLNTAEINAVLNKKSGVASLTKVSSDMRDVQAAMEQGNPAAILAWKMYEYRIVKYIGAYTAALGGLDVLVFTGGVGENQWGFRAEVCDALAFAGVKVDHKVNAVRGQEVEVSTPDSKVRVVVIPTDEELMIATDTMNLAK